MADEIQKRQIAVKTKISELINGKYVKEAGWMPNYILTEKGEKISRINLVGVIITDPILDISYRSVLIDDGSGSISVRAFQENKMFDTLKLGDPIFIIGRPREYNGQIYIVPEIIKKVQNTKWIEVRKLELEQTSKEGISGIDIPIKPAGQAVAGNAGPTVQQPQEKVVEIVEETIDENNDKKEEIGEGKTSEKGEETDISKKIFNIIKDLDKGNGANYEEVISNSSSVDAERIISLLLKEGEIFEISPGKLKVLE